ncbi:hypothetical protein VTJ83DRAFT_2390 [Remersonia thermophila]|uniref:Uncharacterized protein n=1 Tax=Remersonia thermophila TaxID=72144 RepID=A0ABR4DIU0_9PEZI
MDLLFRSSVARAIPKSKGASVERRTEELLKTNGFRGLLDIENEGKMDRLRGQPSAPPPAQFDSTRQKDHLPPPPERPAFSSSPDTFLMTKPAPTPAVPALSLSILRNKSSKKPKRPADGEAEQDTDRQTDAEAPAASDPSHKQVTFLDDEDSMSDQSSICHSPSWENYGQRKKEKKQEAERRKREKEQAEKELKAARKRAAVRLSKLPPPPGAAHPDPRGHVMAAADGSMSDTSLVSRRNVQGALSIPRFATSARAASSDNVPAVAWPRPPVAGPRVASNSPHAERPGSGPQDESRTEEPPRRTSGEQNQPFAASAENESRPARPLFRMPPVRARRQQSTPPLGRTRIEDGSQALGNQNARHGPLPTSPSADNVQASSYVHHQRAQAKQRAIASLVDEHVVAKANQGYPPSRSSTGPAQHGRRLSLTMEAKSVAMRLMNLKGPPTAASKEHAEPRDYAEFKAIQYSSSSDAACSETTASTRASLSGAENACHSTNAERSPTPQQDSTRSSVARGTGSAPPSQDRKSRGLVGAAKAVLSFSKASHKHADDSKASARLPPHPPARSPLRPGSAAPEETVESNRTGAEGSSSAAWDAETGPTAHTKRSTLAPQSEPQASEGSSSTSGCEDGSPIPSGTSTPDTSRPQSAKDVPLASEAEEQPKPWGSQGRGLARGHPLDSSKPYTPPPAGETSAPTGTELGEDERWSRTALPIDIEADADSLTTSTSNQERTGEGHATASTQPLDPRTARPASTAPEPDPSNRPSATEPAVTISPRSGKQPYSSPKLSPALPRSAEPAARDGNGAGGVTGAWTRQEEAAQAGKPPSLGASEAPLGPARNTENPGIPGFAPGRPVTNFSRKPARPTSQPVTGVSSGAGAEGRKDGSGGAPGQEEARPASSPAPAALRVNELSLSTLGTDLSAPNPLGGASGEALEARPLPSPRTTSSSALQVPARPGRQPRAASAPAPPRPPTPSARASGGMPVSILKRPRTPTQDIPPSPALHPQAFSALPRHMQPGHSSMAAAAAAAAGRPALPGAGEGPMAKILVECCSCRFYHDMPSKLYECIAKPDAVVEDRALGISGAITTMVKCPWCGHNMSRDCCAGYAAVVYLKERLH